MARRHIMESTFRLNLLNPQHAKINEVIKPDFIITTGYA